ncbi:Signal recognition particle 54 kDa protein chloroplastic [Bienertia sinuspersici]
MRTLAHYVKFVWHLLEKMEHPEYKKFRNKGVTSTLEDHWTKLFGDSVVTGENVYVPMMDPIEDLTIENENSEEENVGFNGNYINDQFTDALWEEENFVENFKEQAKNSSAQVTNIGQRPTTDIRVSKKVQKQPATKDNSVQIKRTKRQSAGSAMLAKGIGEMAECVKLISQSNASNISSTIPEAIQIIGRMVDNHILMKHDNLWCFTTTLIEDANKREIFLNMEDGNSRLAWLQYLYDKIDN